GLELALACDLRIAAHGTQFGMPPAKLGLVYGHTGIRRFIDAIGAPRARELFLVGRRISPGTALDWGLVNDVVGPDALESASLDWAAELAQNAPLSVRGNKRVFRELLRAEGALDPETERALVALREACFESQDMREGVRAFAEKRAARWLGR
ncbi:MAG: enoyl-CoA hydratase-related protein, partial [Solirubrobacteraceae bacterium]|nr:enoyl-CoA hydratase-related protein [Solirubrobacteraceae bacterium]